MQCQPKAVENPTDRLAALIWPPTAAACATNILAGLIAGIKIVLGMVVFANVIFNTSGNASTSALFATGINMNLMSAVLGIVGSVLFSGMSSIVCPQDVPALLLGQLSSVIAQEVQDPKMAGHTLLVACWASTLLTGVLLLVLGFLRAGDALRRLPSPVVGGFIAAMGATAIRSALQMLSGVPFQGLWPADIAAFAHWKPWAHLGLGFSALLNVRYLGGWTKLHLEDGMAKVAAGPACLLAPPILFYAALLLRGRMLQDLSWMRAMGWLYPTYASRPFHSLWAEATRFDLVDWAVFERPRVLSSLAVAAALTALSAMLAIVGAAGVERSGGGQRADLDRELRGLGLGQLACGAAAGSPGYQQLGISLSMRADGGTHRLAALTAAGLTVGVLISGLPVSSYVPKFYLGGIYLNLGIEFCKTHLVDTLGRMDRASYLAMLIIVTVALVNDLTTAVLVGLVVEAVLFLAAASAIDPVIHCGSTDEISSTCVRSLEASNRLRGELRGRLEVVCLRGPLFFGVAPKLEDGLAALLSAEPAPSHLIVDLSSVTQLDDSGARVLTGALRDAIALGARVAVAGAGEEVAARLMLEGCLPAGLQYGGDVAELAKTLDDVLERYEEELLGETGKDELTEAEAANRLRQQAGLSEPQWEAVVLTGGGLQRWACDQVVFRPSDPCDGIFLLLGGAVAIERELAGASRRISRLVAPTALGVLSFCAGAAAYRVTARACGVAGAAMLHLTATGLERLRAQDLAAYVQLYEGVVARSLSLEAAELRSRALLAE